MLLVHFDVHRPHSHRGIGGIYGIGGFTLHLASAPNECAICMCVCVSLRLDAPLSASARTSACALSARNGPLVATRIPVGILSLESFFYPSALRLRSGRPKPVLGAPLAIRARYLVVSPSA